MTYSIDIINLCFLKLHNKIKKKTISNTLDISINTINQWIYKYNYYYLNKIIITEEIINNYKDENKHKSIKRYEYTNAINTYVKNNMGCSLEDIRKYSTNNMLSKPTICRFLKELNITTKKINNYIVCKDVDKIKSERIEYSKRNIININKFKNSICLDESSFSITDLIRKGYSCKGSPIYKLIKHKRNRERLNLLMAISNNQVIAFEISRSPFNTEKYLDFLTKNIELFHGKTILQDNVRFHHARKIKEYTKMNNINMEYIPAYSPDFNPIEMVFSKIKTEYRKLDHTNIEKDIKIAILKVTSNDLNNCYLHVIKTIDTYSQI